MKNKIIDLTQTMYLGMPDWNGTCGFRMSKVMDYNEGACVHELNIPSGIGTHIDAPSHFIQRGADVSDINVSSLICPGVVIDVRQKADQNYAVSVDDLTEFEEKCGAIPEKSLVIANTGWGHKWEDAVAYRNQDAKGIMHFPRFSSEAAEFLLKRNIEGIAVDTLSPDGSDYRFPVHHVLLGAGKFIIENIINLY